MRTTIITFITCLVLATVGCGGADSPSDAGDLTNVVMLPVEGDPTVSFRILFRAGSQNDPTGKEGLAALTASLIANGSTTKHSYEEILTLLYPMAASVTAQTDKEMTVFSGRTHIDNLDAYYSLLKEILREPSFDESDFTRVKNDRLNYVRTTLRYAQDEELGKETLYEFIFAGTPYGHNEEGHINALNSITLDDVKQFYQTHYTWGNILIGLGGGFDSVFAKQVSVDFEMLTPGAPESVPPPLPVEIEGMQVTIVEKDAGSTAISFGFPVDVKRGSRDFYAVAMAVAWLGEHRSQFSHIFDVIREQRGLNYGDYAYIEHFPQSHTANFPPSNVARRQQIFQIWIRPVPHHAKLFALRAAMRELQALVDYGMSEADFELTKKFLRGYTLHYAPTTMAQLGYAMDDRFYGIVGGHWVTYAKMLDEITREEVNAALKKYLNYENVKIVFITEEAEALRDALVKNTPSPISYESEKPAEIIEEDKEISVYPLTVVPENVTIIKVEELFEG